MHKRTPTQKNVGVIILIPDKEHKKWLLLPVYMENIIKNYISHENLKFLKILNTWKYNQAHY